MRFLAPAATPGKCSADVCRENECVGTRGDQPALEGGASPPGDMDSEQGGSWGWLATGWGDVEHTLRLADRVAGKTQTWSHGLSSECWR